MTRLGLGVLLWSMVHFFSAIAPASRKSLIERFGEYPYKGVFTMLMIVSIYLIVSGWSSLTPPEPGELSAIYATPEWRRYATAVLVLIGFVLFFAPYPANNFKRLLRHPQLTGVVCWGVGHLLVSATARSLVFFGGLAAWALIEIVLINQRDGEWHKPGRAPLKNDVLLVVFAVLVYLACLYTHHLLFGHTNLV